MSRMKTLVRRALATKAGSDALHVLGEFGINPFKTYLGLRGLPAFVMRSREFRKQAAHHAHEFGPVLVRPYLGDALDRSGSASGHYFHQDLLVARRIFHNRPVRHIDIGSRVDGFVAHVAAFREIEVFDIRPQTAEVQNIVFRTADLSAQDWPFVECCDSISSLHAIEHIGLGRYGDPVRYSGHLRALDNIWLTLQRGGKFYFSVPIGRQRVEYDGQRVFDLGPLLELLRERYRVDAFSYVGDDGQLRENAVLDRDAVARNFDCNYACGIFELSKT